MIKGFSVGLRQKTPCFLYPDAEDRRGYRGDGTVVFLEFLLMQEAVVGVASESEVEAGAVLEKCGVEVGCFYAIESLQGIPSQQVGDISSDCFRHAFRHGIEETKFHAHIAGIHIGIEVREIDIALKLSAKFLISFFHAHHGEALPVGGDAFGLRVQQAIPGTFAVDDVENLFFVDGNHQRVFWLVCVGHGDGGVKIGDE